MMATDEMLSVIEEAKREIIKLRADNTYLAKTLLEMGEKVVMFTDEFEDEGDRVYFGSTNHADYLRELRHKLDGVWYDRELVDEAAKAPDLYADLRGLRREVARYREALEAIRDLPGEINPSNYDHDDVCALNSAHVEAFGIATAALEAQPN